MALSLESALLMVPRTADDVKVARQNVQVIDQSIDVANSEFWPKVGVTSRAAGFHSENGFHKSTLFDPSEEDPLRDMVTYDLFASYPLYSGGLNAARKNLAVQSKRVAQFEVQTAIKVSREVVIEKYFQVLALSEKAQYFSSLQAFVSKAVERARASMAAGAFDSHEVLALEMSQSNLRTKFWDTDLAYVKALRDLKRLLGMSESQNLKLTDSLRAERRVVPPLSLADTLLASDPGNKIFQAQADVIDERASMDLAIEYPRLELEGRYGTYTKYAGIALKVPLFSGFSYRAKRGLWAQEQAKLEVTSRRYQGFTRDEIITRLDVIRRASSHIDEIMAPLKRVQRNWKRVNSSFKFSGSGIYLWKTALEELISTEMTMIDQFVLYRVNSEIIKNWTNVN